MLRNMKVGAMLGLGFGLMGLLMLVMALGKMFSQVKGIGGFTILGTGDVALIMDVPRLMKQALGSEQQALAG